MPMEMLFVSEWVKPVMNKIDSFIRNDLKSLKNYEVQPITGMKMDANESPFPLGNQFRQRMAQWIMESEDFRYYPDTECNILREKIAELYGLDKAQILCGVGSDQLIDYLTKTFLEPGDLILAPEPSFSMYRIAAMINHGRAEAIALDPKDFSYPVDDITTLCKKKNPKLLFICTPNNPTGSIIPKEDVIKILESVNCIVVLDAAYGEFTDDTYVELLEEYAHLVLLKTFSKSYGLAGLRVGYAMAQTEIIEALKKVQAPYNLNTFSQLAASMVLEGREYKNNIIWIKEEKDRIYSVLKDLEGKKGLYTFESHANFLFLKSGVPDLGARLLEQGVLVREYDGDMSMYIRVSVGTQEANLAFIKAMEGIFHD